MSFDFRIDQFDLSYDVFPTECGVPAISPFARILEAPKIVGGIDAIRNSWPWMVLLRIVNNLTGSSFLCGASLINREVKYMHKK